MISIKKLITLDTKYFPKCFVFGPSRELSSLIQRNHRSLGYDIETRDGELVFITSI